MANFPVVILAVLKFNIKLNNIILKLVISFL